MMVMVKKPEKTIAKWLNKDSKVIGPTKIGQILNINDNLSEELKSRIGEKGDLAIQITRAGILSTLDSATEQEEINNALNHSKVQNVKKQARLIAKYRALPKSIQKKLNQNLKLYRMWI